MFEHYAKAPELKHNLAAYKLALYMCYLYGLNAVTFDRTKAVALLKLYPRFHGYSSLLAQCMLNGWSTDVDEQGALNLFRGLRHVLAAEARVWRRCSKSTAFDC